MARALWKGAISFGLVTIPISLYPAKSTKEAITFHNIDRRDRQRVHYKRVDEKDHEVPYEEIAKGYEYEPDQYVLIGEEDLKAANVEATQSIDIMSFVDESEIDTVYYEIPYYIEPAKAGRKAYALLREVLRRTKKVGVAKVVIRTRQRLCAVKVDGLMLLVEILRWPYELRSASEFNLPAENLEELDVSPQELQMAEQLVNAMASEWDPSQYRDTYREDVLKLIDEKVKRGELTEITQAPAAGREAGAKVVDMMSMLRKSMEQQQKTGSPEGGRREREAEKGRAQAAKQKSEKKRKSA